MSWDFLPPLLAGAALAFIAGLIQDHRSRSDERARWKRDHRLDAYTAYSAATVRLKERLQEKEMVGERLSREDTMLLEEITHADEAWTRLCLVAPLSVHKASSEVADALSAYMVAHYSGSDITEARQRYVDAQARLTTAARADLTTDDR